MTEISADVAEFEPTDPAVPLPETARHVPRGRRVVLHRRGTTFVRSLKGPPGAPTVVLLHGWMATAALNWNQAFLPLAEHFRVLAPDLRGHGRGIRTGKAFRLADCAADVAETLRALDAEPAIVVGYSMGGPVAQLLWRDHREVVSGMVLCATGADMFPGNRERYIFSALAQILAGTTRVGTVVSWLPASFARRALGVPARGENPAMADWARREMSKHNVRMLLEAGHALANYSGKSFIHHIDVPTSVLITSKDSAVSPTAQFRMARAIPYAHINLIDDGHVACMNPDFGRKVTDACVDVQRRVELMREGDWPHTVESV